MESFESDRTFLSPQEVADSLGASRGYVYRLIESGDLKSVKLGGRRFIPASEIQRLTRMAEFNRDRESE
jgi:excisionase family DNA binding protein